MDLMAQFGSLFRLRKEKALHHGNKLRARRFALGIPEISAGLGESARMRENDSVICMVVLKR